MLFAAFSSYLEKLERISARLEITAVLAELWQKLEPDELKPASYLLQGTLVPEYESLEFQLSTKMVIKALATRYGTDVDTVTAAFKKLGDLGLVAEQFHGEGAQSSDLFAAAAEQNLDVATVYEKLKAIAQQSGSGSQERKLALLSDILASLEAISARYVIRIILGNLRLGFSTMTMIDSLSWAQTGSKLESIILEKAYYKKADIGALAETYISAKGEDKRKQSLEHYSVEVGVPVVPALCQRMESAEEVNTKLGTVFVEPKYDGVRVQIHVDKKNAAHPVRTFTRSMEENTHQFPELVDAITQLKCDSCILDGEAIGYNKETGELLPFQETITRKRKHGVDEIAEAVPLRFFLFDVLAFNEKSFLDVPLRERKSELKKLFSDSEVLVHTPYITADKPEDITEYHHLKLAEGLEGVVMKQADSLYQSGRKGMAWVKMKEEEGTRGKLADSLDCVVMGYYVGQGKRTDFGVGAFLVGVMDDKDQILTIAKIGTGLSDDQFRELKQRADTLQVSEKPQQYNVAKQLVPDVWLKPSLVAEIAADEITDSPLHSAKVALRFPRLIKWRDDKKWQQATTTAEVGKIRALFLGN
jgi:DNA ligase-1